MYEAALLSANTLVGSCLDNCNSLFRSRSAVDLCRLQCVQNSLARIVAIIPSCTCMHITPVRKSCLYIKHCSFF